MASSSQASPRANRAEARCFGPRKRGPPPARPAFDGSASLAITPTSFSLRHAPRLPDVASPLRLRSRRPRRAKRATGTFRPPRALAREAPVAPKGRIRASPGSQAHGMAACLQDMDSSGQTVVPPVCPPESSCPPQSARGVAHCEIDSLPPKDEGPIRLLQIGPNTAWVSSGRAPRPTTLLTTSFDVSCPLTLHQATRRAISATQ